MHLLGRVAIATTAFLALTTTVSAQATPTAGLPALKTVTPVENQTLYGQKVPVLFLVENFQLQDYAQYPTAAAGQGHIHAWLDSANPTKETAAKIIKDNYTFENVVYGNHTLIAELVNNDHTSLNPPVTLTVKFTSAPFASPAPAVSSGFDKNTALVILVVVALVIVAAWWYTKEEDDEKPASRQDGPTPPAQGTKKTSKKKTQKRKSKK